MTRSRAERQRRGPYTRPTSGPGRNAQADFKEPQGNRRPDLPDSDRTLDDSAHNSAMVSAIVQPQDVDDCSSRSVLCSEPVLSNQLLLATLSARDIITVQSLCKSGAAWFAEASNIANIGDVRSKDTTRDWYFPIVVQKTTEEVTGDTPSSSQSSSSGPRCSWLWSGIWHASAGHSSGPQLHELPPLSYLPPKWVRASHPQFDIVTSAGGLLLIRTDATVVRAPRSGRLKPYRRIKGLACNCCLSCSCALVPGGKRKSHGKWEPLMVTNPLTREFRVLPTPDCREAGAVDWAYRGTVAHMVVDEQANSYEVVLTFLECLWVYTSTSDRWKCVWSDKFGPWAVANHGTCWGYCGASVCANGRLFLADTEAQVYAVRNDLYLAGSLRLWEVDYEAGELKVCNSFLVRKFPERHGQCRRRIHVGFQRRLSTSMSLGLVKCMGSLFVVLPARLDEVLCLSSDIGDRGPLKLKYYPLDEKHMPLQFYIYQVQGDNLQLVNGVLRIEPPETRRDLQSRTRSLFVKSMMGQPRNWQSWFQCTAEGSMIWVSCEDYLLKYDVLTGQSETQIVPVNVVGESFGFAFRPSFHMKP